jgi:hypothetical protein
MQVAWGEQDEVMLRGEPEMRIRDEHDADREPEVMII